LLDPVIGYFKPRRVILFGSRARGEATRDSDIDLLVIVDDGTPSGKLTWKAEYEAHRSHRAADVPPMHAETFERYRNIVGTLAAEADADGIRPATDFRVADTFTASPVDRMARRGPTGQRGQPARHRRTPAAGGSRGSIEPGDRHNAGDAGNGPPSKPIRSN
jgi:hypothetical protein